MSTTAQLPGPNPSFGQNAQGQYDFNGNSGDPSDATGYYPTQQAAENAWITANGGTVATPTLSPTYNPTPPAAQATTTNVDTSPQATIQQILTGFAPQAAQSNMNLQNSLAASGISGGANADATTNLQAQLAASLAPTLGSAIQNSQGLSLNQAQNNASSLNNSNDFNIQNLLSSQFANTNSANSLQNLLLQLQNSDWQQQLGAYTGLNEAGLSGQQSINSGAAQNYPIQSGAGSAFGSLGSALGSIYGNSAGSQYANNGVANGAGVDPIQTGLGQSGITLA